MRRRGEEGGQSTEGSELGLRSRRCRRADALSVDTLQEVFNGVDQQRPAETPGDRFGLREELPALLDVAFLEVETAHTRERSGVVREVAQLLQLVETPLPKTDRAIPA